MRGPTFQHTDPGTAPESWRPVLDCSEAVDLPDRDTRIVVLAAHPDDETLAAGGIIATAAARGHRVDVIIATDGEASHPHSPTHTPAQLARIRRQEAASAVHALSPEAGVRFLALPDGHLDDSVDELTSVLDRVIDGDTWLLAPWFEDGHPDHQACAAACRRVVARHRGVRLWEYPIWAWHWGDPAGTDLPVDSLRRVRIDEPAQQARSLALDCYASQTGPLSGRRGDEAVVPPSFLAHFTRPFDVLLDASAANPAEARYFDALYRHCDDPWGLADRWYEQRKRQLLLAALPRRRFRRTFEPGCATGLLTAQLAARSDSVLAVDAATQAVELTRERLIDVPNTQVRQMHIPEQWPDDRFDLVVLSEVAYYCPDLAELARCLAGSLTPDGIVVLCHWRRPAPDHPHRAETVHAELPELARLHALSRHVEADFILDVLAVSPESVAETEGIVQ